MNKLLLMCRLYTSTQVWNSLTPQILVETAEAEIKICKHTYTSHISIKQYSPDNGQFEKVLSSNFLLGLHFMRWNFLS